MADNTRFRWLGTAGIEIEFRGERILIDPYLSRFPIWHVLFGRPTIRRDLISKYLRPALAILVSHAHYDHLADVPEICRALGGVVYGSPNTSAIVSAHGIPSRKIRTVYPGDTFTVRGFSIRIYPGRHGRMFGMLPYAGRLPRRLTPPLRLADYRMDGMYSFHIAAGGTSILVWNDSEAAGAPPADAVFYCPLWGAEAAACLARAAHARMFIPVHWDNFFSALDQPTRPLIVPPGWRSPWIRRVDPRPFAVQLQKEVPSLHVFLPVPFTEMTL
jgi:L-ascorbate metabolism protein UlaG (beta-lactamase superfamily)